MEEGINMRYFHFDNLIDKYSVDFTVISQSQGYYDDMGEWQAGTRLEIPKKGAIIGVSATKMYRAEGMLTAQDKELFMKESIGCDFDKAHVIYAGNKYKVESQPNDNSEFTGVFGYVLKYVSAFGGVETD